MNASYEWLRAIVRFKSTPGDWRDLITPRCSAGAWLVLGGPHVWRGGAAEAVRSCPGVAAAYLGTAA